MNSKEMSKNDLEYEVWALGKMNNEYRIGWENAHRFNVTMMKKCNFLEDSLEAVKEENKGLKETVIKLKTDKNEILKDMQILFDMLSGGEKNDFEQQRIGEMYNLCF